MAAKHVPGHEFHLLYLRPIMGIVDVQAAFLAHEKRKVVSFNRVLTIGRQSQYLSRNLLISLSNRYGLTFDIQGILNCQYADMFLKALLNINTLQSLDYSPYESSDIIHDMNHSVSDDLHQRFDVVIDGGSLEHVFNLPVALANCMNLVKRGGSIFMFSPANNCMGHGFYQFSPELYFRVFRPDNGFAVQEIILTEHPFPGTELSPSVRCFSVVDPEIAGSRVNLVSRRPIGMMVHAIRTEIKPIFARFPLQSDYASTYALNDKITAPTTSKKVRMTFKNAARVVLNNIPSKIRNEIIGRYQLFVHSFANERHYKRWYP